MSEPTTKPSPKPKGPRRIALFLSPETSARVRELLHRSGLDQEELNANIQAPLDALVLDHLLSKVIDLMEVLKKSLSDTANPAGQVSKKAEG